MKFFFDTEFIERGPKWPVTLISIGIVDERGGTFYAVSADFREEDCSDWVKANVLPHIEGQKRLPLSDIAILIREWVDVQCDGAKPEFWAYYADYDWVVLAQVFGTMMDLPKGWPMYCRDIKQLCDSLGNPKLPKQSEAEHDALSDAKWNKLAYEFLATPEAAPPLKNQVERPIARWKWMENEDGDFYMERWGRGDWVKYEDHRKVLAAAVPEHPKVAPALGCDEWLNTHHPKAEANQPNTIFIGGYDEYLEGYESRALLAAEAWKAGAASVRVDPEAAGGGGRTVSLSHLDKIQELLGSFVFASDETLAYWAENAPMWTRNLVDWYGANELIIDSAPPSGEQAAPVDKTRCPYCGWPDEPKNEADNRCGGCGWPVKDMPAGFHAMDCPAAAPVEVQSPKGEV